MPDHFIPAGNERSPWRCCSWVQETWCFDFLRMKWQKVRNPICRDRQQIKNWCRSLRTKQFWTEISDVFWKIGKLDIGPHLVIASYPTCICRMFTGVLFYLFLFLFSTATWLRSWESQDVYEVINLNGNGQLSAVVNVIQVFSQVVPKGIRTNCKCILSTALMKRVLATDEPSPRNKSAGKEKKLL